MNKSAQLQIRVSPEQKYRIKAKALRAGEDVSRWVLRRLLPECADELQSMIDTLGASPQLRSQMLAEVHDFLVSSDSIQLGQALTNLDLSELAAFEANYVAAMVETACANRDISSPPWLKRIAPLADPWFATSLKSLRLHLLTASPPPFRRRNLYIDSTLGARV
ncbi:MAG: hypothetical protein NXH85_00435 [Pseudomonadaceae bacterium]|nr:hypothetical protein [Pseudomonadaceae bacterium]